MKFLIIGDIVGKIGREALIRALPSLKAEHQPDLIVANAENLAHGRGVTHKTVAELHAAGIDFLTSGNHIFDNPGVHQIWADPNLKDILIRPANYPEGTAGEGHKVVEVGGNKVLVINLLCRVFMDQPYPSAFEALDRILKTHEGETLAAVLVDLHGEATSERIAFGWYADGRVSTVTGTHTHVPTADERILPKGTAYLTDIGMTGARDSILGMEPAGPLSLFTPGAEAVRFQVPEEGPVDLNAVVVEVDPTTRRATSITRIHKIIE